MNLYKKLFWVFTLCYSLSYAQQDPQFTQYMYNTMSINPAYTGSLGHPVITLLGRSQWVGFKGTPDTQTLSYHDTNKNKNLGYGINLMNDKIGPTNEIFTDLNVSYAIRIGESSKLALGLKAGGRFLNINENKLNPAEAESLGDNRSSFLPTIGTGLYYYSKSYYLGLSAPNLLKTEHYKKNNIRLGTERLHFYGIAGYVFNLHKDLKFKPASLVKIVDGAPVSLDISGNFLIKNKFHAGMSWRWDDSVSALLGFQVNEKIHIGYAYDRTTSPNKITNNGSHELFLKYHFIKPYEIIASPRFF